MKDLINWSNKQDIISRYRTRVPRYTSYPPATSFGEAGSERAAKAYGQLRRSASNDPISLYVHLPFCQSMCRYCGCAAIASKTGKRWVSYMSLLTQEMSLVANAIGHKRALSQLHWGGGTPNWLPPDMAAAFYESLTHAFPLTEDAEVAIEIDPKTLRPGQLSSLRNLGFNRASFGIQDTNPAVQMAVGRILAPEAAADVMAEAHELQFESINIDLMYGLPRQTIKTFRDTIQLVASWKPHRISLFGYAHVPWMRPHQTLMPEDELPTAQLRVRLFTAAAELLHDHGYHHLGLDHFVLPSDPLAKAQKSGELYRNFQGYSIRRAKDLIGLGMSAIGHISGHFLANQRTLTKYQSATARKHFPTERAYKPTKVESAIASSINEVMCHGKLNLEQASAQFGGPSRLYGTHALDRLNTLKADGLIEMDGQTMNVTPTGRFVLRHVAAALDPRFNAVEVAEAVRERFSSGL